MTDRWSESGRSYLGRSHGRMTMNFSHTVETRFIMRSQQKSYYHDSHECCGKDGTIGGLRILKNSREMRKLQKTSYKEDWSWQVEVELQETMGVHSISTAFERGKDDGKLCTNNLLEKILESENLRIAFKRVKSNKEVMEWME